MCLSCLFKVQLQALIKPFHKLISDKDISTLLNCLYIAMQGLKSN